MFNVVKTKFKILLFLFLSFILSGFLSANPLELEYDILKSRIDLLQEKMKTCENLSSREKINCIDEIIKEMNETKIILDKYAEEIGDKVEKIQKDIKTLKNQINYLDAVIRKTEIEIKTIEQQINLINFDILKTEELIKITIEEIKNIEKKINKTKENLAKNIREIYEYDDYNLIKLTLGTEKFSDFFNEIIYLENLKKKIKENLNKLKIEKRFAEEKEASLEKEKEALEGKKIELEVKIDNFKKKIFELDQSKQQKAILLEVTEGDEERYQKIMAEIEAQKRELLGDLAFLSQQRQAEIEALIEATGGRLCNYFNVPYFAQDDPRWANLNIGGFPNVSMARWGCAVTSVSMIFTKFGIDINPGILSQEKIYVCYKGDCGLIAWPQIWPQTSPKVKRVIGTRTPVNWERIDQELEKQIPVIINIKIPGKGQHYVVIVGKTSNGYIVNDPLSSVGCGVNLRVSKENIERIYNQSAIHDQMIIYHSY